MSFVCTRMSSVCHSYVIRRSFVCTRMTSVCHSYAIRMSLVCHPHVLICHPYVLVCHPYVLVCQPYFTRLWFYHEPCQNVSKEVFFTRAQISSEHSKPLWRLCLECGIVIHSQSTNKGLWTLYLA